VQNPKQEVKNNIKTRLEDIEHYSRNERTIRIGMLFNLRDLYCSVFSKHTILKLNIMYKILTY